MRTLLFTEISFSSGAGWLACSAGESSVGEGRAAERAESTRKTPPTMMTTRVLLAPTTGSSIAVGKGKAFANDSIPRGDARRHRGPSDRLASKNNNQRRSPRSRPRVHAARARGAGPVRRRRSGDLRRARQAPRDRRVPAHEDPRSRARRTMWVCGSTTRSWR